MRSQLVKKLREAHAEYDRCKSAFAAPYSGRDAEVKMYRAEGRCLGLAEAIELYDALHEGQEGGGPDAGA